MCPTRLGAAHLAALAVALFVVVSATAVAGEGMDSGPLLYGSYIGSSEADYFYDMQGTPDGNLVIVGKSYDPYFPVPVQWPHAGEVPPASHGFVIKVDMGGRALWSVSVPVDSILRVAVIPDGDLIVMGRSGPSMETTAGVVQPKFGGGAEDAVVLRLDGDAGATEWATYLGGNDSAFGKRDFANDLAVDPSGNIYVGGGAGADDFPVTGPPIALANGSNRNPLSLPRSFVTSIAPDGASFRYSRFYHGIQIVRMVADPDGAVFVAARAASPATTPGAFQEQRPAGNGGGTTAFLAKIKPGGTGVEFATFLSGSSDEYACSIAVNGKGEAAMGGYTYSLDFPVTQGPTSLSGERQLGFVAQLSADGGSLVFSTLISPTGWSNPCTLRFGPSDDLYVAGAEGTPNIPQAGPWTPALLALDLCPNCTENERKADAFLVAFSGEDHALTFAAELGGSGYDSVTGLVAGGDGDIFVLMNTGSADAPTTSGGLTEAPGRGNDRGSGSGDGVFLHIVLQPPPDAGTSGLGGTFNDLAAVALAVVLAFVTAVAAFLGISFWRRQQGEGG